LAYVQNTKQIVTRIKRVFSSLSNPLLVEINYRIWGKKIVSNQKAVYLLPFLSGTQSDNNDCSLEENKKIFFRS